MDGKIALIEAGGTKFVLGVGDASRTLHATTRIETTLPDEVISAAMQWFRDQRHDYAALGIASFGPLDLDRGSPTWGYITGTTKPHWSHTDLAGPLGSALGCPVAIDTDVNGAALAEWKWGAGQGQRCALYLTIGTGIGGGAVMDGRLVHGLSHPEMGHIRMPRHPADAGFAGACPFHGDCLEGLAAGPSIIKRWSASLSELPSDHEAHDIIAWYIAQAAATFQAILEPGRLILGGGVMGSEGLIERIRAQAETAFADYFVGKPKDLIVAPGLGTDAGLMGALALALSIDGGDI